MLKDLYVDADVMMMRYVVVLSEVIMRLYHCRARDAIDHLTRLCVLLDEAMKCVIDDRQKERHAQQGRSTIQ